MRRTTRRLDLTDAGRDFVTRARAILAGVEEAKSAVRPGRGVAGRVVLSVPSSLGLGQIASARARAARRQSAPAHRDAVRGPRGRPARGRRRPGRSGRPRSSGQSVRGGSTPGARSSAWSALRHASSPRRVASTKSRSSPELPCVLHGAAPTEWGFQTADGPRIGHGRRAAADEQSARRSGRRRRGPRHRLVALVGRRGRPSRPPPRARSRRRDDACGSTSTACFTRRVAPAKRCARCSTAWRASFRGASGAPSSRPRGAASAGRGGERKGGGTRKGRCRPPCCGTRCRGYCCCESATHRGRRTRRRLRCRSHVRR